MKPWLTAYAACLTTSALALQARIAQGQASAEVAQVSANQPTTGQDKRGPRDVHPRVRGAWLFLQTLPSPGMAWGERGVHGTMTWQVTPLLYSWAMDSRLSPWRLFVVEPLVRQSGSVELFFSPEYLGRGAAERNYGFRTGLRAYFPLTERGDGLSCSVGASLHWFPNEPGATFDAGMYTLFGGLGLLVSVSPWLSDNLVQTSLRVRYF